MNTILVEEYTSEVKPEVIQQLAEDGETLMLLDELELEGQKSLYQSSDSTETVKPHPYRTMTAEEMVVFDVCFPTKCEVVKYKQCPIPLRVLQIISHVRSLNNPDMAYIEVWAPKPGVVDPLLVARKSHYQGPLYLLARWGSSLTPFKQLQEKAIEIVTAKAKAALQQGQSEINAALQNVVAKVRAAILDGSNYAPYINV